MQDAGASALWGLWELVSRNQAMHCWGKVLGLDPIQPSPTPEPAPGSERQRGDGVVCAPAAVSLCVFLRAGAPSDPQHLGLHCQMKSQLPGHLGEGTWEVGMPPNATCQARSHRPSGSHAGGPCVLPWPSHQEGCLPPSSLSIPRGESFDQRDSLCVLPTSHCSSYDRAVATRLWIDPEPQMRWVLTGNGSSSRWLALRCQPEATTACCHVGHL